MSYQAAVWYRHESDDDQSVRLHPQMEMHVDHEGQLQTEVRALTARGYHVQKAIMRLVCPACHGVGRIAVRPKGMRRTTAATLPSWRLAHKDCQACQGDGWIDAAEVHTAERKEG